MTSKERVIRQIRGETIDHIPLMGGWFNDVDNLAGLNVTRTLPLGTIDDVREEIQYVMSYTSEGKGLFFFTSSSIGPEVPLENVKFAYKYIADRERRQTERSPTYREWPWRIKHEK